MAHVMKHTKAACGHMFAHFDRKAENISNENLDRTRTHLNYNLAIHQTMDQGEFVRKRCAEVRCQNRKDVNVMVSWVVTAPKDLPEAEHKAFFQACYDFLENRYGKDNVVSAYVHMDETAPHMHFAFVPVVQDRKRDCLKVSAKEAVNRQDLRTFHKDLERHVESMLGHEVGILNDATKEGNRSIEQLKQNTAIEQLQSIEQKVQDLTAEKNALMGQVMQSKAELDSYASMVKDIKSNVKGAYVYHAAKNSILTGNKEAYYEVPEKDMKKFLKAAKSLDVMQGSLESIGKANLILQQRNNILQSAEEKAESIIEAAKGKSVKMTLQQAKAEADRQNAMRKYEMFMDAHPNIKEQFEKEQRGNHFRSQEHKR